MATSGQKKVTVFQELAGGKVNEVYLIFDWQRTAYSIVNNTSTITWQLSIQTINTEIDLGFIGGGNTQDSYVMVEGNEYENKVDVKTDRDTTKILVSGTDVIKHNSDGTKTFVYAFSQTFGWFFGIASGSNMGTLDPIPVAPNILTAHDFNDEENPTITYSNPAGEEVTSLKACISFNGTKDDVPYRDISKTGTSYTFELTDEERATLRAGVDSDGGVAVRFYVTSVIGGETYYSYLTKRLLLINHKPTLTPNIKDTNARTIELTGDSNKLIKYYSNASVTFGAAARKGATIVDRRVICGSKTIEIEDSAQDTTTVNAVDSNTFYMRARDSRGYIVERAPVKALVEYIKLTNNLTTQAISSTGNLTFTIKGKYFNGSFGAKRNSLEVEYLVVDENGDPVFNTSGSGWVVLGAVTPTVSDGDYTYSYTITGLDYTKTYTLTVNAIDELTPVQTSSKTVAAIPVFDWDNSNFKHHTNVYIDNNKTLRSYQTDGSDVQILGLNNSNGTVLGWGGYDKSNGDTGVYGNNVKLHFKNSLYINNRQYGANKTLWNGAYYMNASQTITLSEAISAQPNGIVLVFSHYDNGTSSALNVGWSTHFVPKSMVAYNGDGGQSFLMGLNAGFSLIGAKYLYIEDTTISGHSGNTSKGTNSGITFDNSQFVLRYVIGV